MVFTSFSVGREVDFVWLCSVLPGRALCDCAAANPLAWVASRGDLLGPKHGLSCLLTSVVLPRAVPRVVPGACSLGHLGGVSWGGCRGVCPWHLLLMFCVRLCAFLFGNHSLGWGCQPSNEEHPQKGGVLLHAPQRQSRCRLLWDGGVLVSTPWA